MSKKQTHQRHPNTPARRGRRGKTGQIRSPRQLAPSNINQIRVRTKRLDEIDEDKIALAFYLLAREICEDRTDVGALTDENVSDLAESIEDSDPEDDQEAA